MEPKQAVVYLTDRASGDLLAQKGALTFQDDLNATENALINVYDDARYQEIIGFGGAFTEAAADTFYKLPPALQQEFMARCFDPADGLGYTFCRTHINSCDFALGNYACADKPGDVALESFNLRREQQSLIPMIQQAAHLTPLKLFVSPWSPPAWMKSNGEMNHGGKLLTQYAVAWGEYFARFIEAFEQEGIPVWGLTVQNEPNATQTWDSCRYTAEEEAAFVTDYLHPALERHGLERVRIMVWDHNKERVYDRAREIFQNKLAAEYVWGIAYHWYSGDHFEALELSHHAWPDKPLVFSEGCVGRHEGFNSWQAAEAYAHDLIGDLNNHTAAWCDWNLLLDHQGGPNHVRNFCCAPIMASEDFQRLDVQPSYWYIGHFTRFIQPGSVRIGCTRYTDRLECTAFLRPDGRRVLVVLNRNTTPIPFTLRCRERITQTVSAPQSIQTLVF